MREIKFRAIAKCIHHWSGYNATLCVVDGQLVEGFYLKDVINNNGENSFTHAHYIRIVYGDHYADIEVDPETVAQYTGLKDKNVVEIYEKDRVKVKWLAELGITEFDCEYVGTILMNDLCWVVSFSDKAFIRNVGEEGVYSVTEIPLSIESHDDDVCLEFEVIGNYRNHQNARSKTNE